jgi:methionine synthase II (cobalamin-independent)
MFLQYFDPVFEGVVERLARFANHVAPDVELGFHFCYGDIGHEHFIQPKDTRLMVEVGNALAEAVHRPIQWIHLPVPKDRTDEAYFAPLKELKRAPGAELYLGCVHFGDLEGTRERVRRAKEVLGHGDFRVGTECGMGRTPKEEFEGIVGILKEVGGEVY